MSEQITDLKKEIEQLENDYSQAQARSFFDRKRAEQLYKKLKKKRKELDDLEKN